VEATLGTSKLQWLTTLEALARSRAFANAFSVVLFPFVCPRVAATLGWELANAFGVAKQIISVA
jgi:hypothetical protein